MYSQAKQAKYMEMNKEKGVSDTLQTNSLYIFFELA